MTTSYSATILNFIVKIFSICHNNSYSEMSSSDVTTYRASVSHGINARACKHNLKIAYKRKSFVLIDYNISMKEKKHGSHLVLVMK